MQKVSLIVCHGVPWNEWGRDFCTAFEEEAGAAILIVIKAKDFVFSGRKRLFWLCYSCTTSLKCRHNQGYYYCSLKIMTRNEMSDISSLFLPLSYDVTPSPPFWLP